MSLTCFECGREIPAGRVERREVAVARHQFSAGAFPVSGGGGAYGGAFGKTTARVSLCRDCADALDRRREATRKAVWHAAIWVGIVLAALMLLAGAVMVVALLPPPNR